MIMVFKTPFSNKYLSYIVAVSFISWGNRFIWRKTPTCHNSL